VLLLSKMPTISPGHCFFIESLALEADPLGGVGLGRGGRLKQRRGWTLVHLDRVRSTAVP
jgi:hypothetical protein